MDGCAEETPGRTCVPAHQNSDKYDQNKLRADRNAFNNGHDCQMEAKQARSLVIYLVKVNKTPFIIKYNQHLTEWRQNKRNEA